MLLGTMKCNSLRMEFCKLGIKNLHCYCDGFVFLRHKVYRFVIDVPTYVVHCYHMLGRI